PAYNPSSSAFSLKRAVRLLAEAAFRTAHGGYTYVTINVTSLDAAGNRTLMFSGAPATVIRTHPPGGVPLVTQRLIMSNGQGSLVVRVVKPGRFRFTTTGKGLRHLVWTFALVGNQIV